MSKHCSKRSVFLAFAMLAATVATVPAAQAQDLLKPGQGLVGAPQPIEPNPEARNRPDDATKLPEVNVEGRKNPLVERDKELNAKKKKLPTLGSDKARKKGAGEKAIDAYNKLEKDPNKLDPGTQEFIDGQVNSTDLNPNHARGTALPRRDAADYVDPIANDQKAAKKK